MTIVLLVEPLEDGLCLRHEVVSELARLGITNVTLLCDEQTMGVILEGWLFDPIRSAAVAAKAIGTATPTRTLHPLMQLALPAATELAQSKQPQLT